MSNTSLPGSPLDKKIWSPAELADEHKEAAQYSLVKWWYDLTALPEPEVNASFVKRETARKSRLFSTVLFYFTLVLIVFFPCCLLLPNKYDIWIDGILIVLSIVSLVLNRQGQTTMAGIIVVAAFQLALTIIIFTTTPFDETSIQIYDLFIMTELLTVSLLPPQTVFILAVANSAVIVASLLYEPHTQILAIDLQTQFIPVMIRPVALQFIIAGVTYVWVYSTLKAISRADRAEMVASLEHALVEQKRELEVGIEQILQTHVAVANGNFNARAPLSQDNVLWQIARALNTLLVRLQRASQAEKELQRVQQAVAYSVNMIQQAEQHQQPPRLPFTQTAIDPLVVALQGKTLSYTQPPFFQQGMPGKSEPNSSSSLHNIKYP